MTFFLAGLPRFNSGDAAPQGFNDFFEAYIRRKTRENITQNLKILFVDEFASLVQLIEDKKEREAAQRKLALLLMLSRSRHFSVQLATQQPSAQIFGAAHLEVARGTNQQIRDYVAKEGK